MSEGPAVLVCEGERLAGPHSLFRYLLIWAQKSAVGLERGAGLFALVPIEIRKGFATLTPK
jgi:hypothetical protein